MASIATDRAGNRRVLFFDAGGRRRTLHLGKLPLPSDSYGAWYSSLGAGRPHNECTILYVTNPAHVIESGACC